MARHDAGQQHGRQGVHVQQQFLQAHEVPGRFGRVGRMDGIG